MADYLEIGISPEFITLCQQQVILLSASLGANDSVVYVTEAQAGGETKLIPVVVYPPNQDFARQLKVLPLFSDKSPLLESSPRGFFVPDSEGGGGSKNEIENQLQHRWQSNPYQLILPLIHEDLMVGLLAAKRNNFEWQESEISQVENIAHTLAIARILDRKQLGERRQLIALRQLKQLQGDRLDDFLHQLRNPLTALRTFAKLLLRHLLPEDPQYQITANIIKQSDRLQDLIQDFGVDWRSLNNSSEPLKPASNASAFLLPGNAPALDSIEIVAVLEPLLLGIKAIAADRDIELIADLDGNLPPVLANAKALTEIFNNLLDNALKYTPPGGKIYLALQQEKKSGNEETVTVEISDTGCGIPPQDREHIFERHYRGIQAQGDIKGTGLGLAIVKDLCAKMNAQIEIFSPSLRDEKKSLPGTTFKISLPANPKSA